MAHEHYKEMLTARALLVLDAGENSALNEHLVSCGECRQALSELENTSALLAYGAEPVEPSAGLRDRILGEIRKERTGGGARVVPFAQPQRNVWTSIGSLGAIAASILFVALLAAVFLLWRENRQAKYEIARLTSDMKSTEAQLSQQREIVALLSTAGSRIAELGGTNAAPAGAHALLGYDQSGRAILVTNGLPSAPPGKGYQLWYIVDNKPIRGRVFNTDNSGSGTLHDQMPGSAMQKAVFAVTMESAAGADSPTGAILLRSGL